MRPPSAQPIASTNYRFFVGVLHLRPTEPSHQHPAGPFLIGENPETYKHVLVEWFYYETSTAMPHADHLLPETTLVSGTYKVQMLNGVVFARLRCQIPLRLNQSTFWFAFHFEKST